MRSRLCAMLVAVAVLACGEPSSSGPPSAISGPWAFSQTLVGQIAGTGCRNHGTVTVAQNASSFTATYTQTGFCYGPGGAGNSGAGTIDDGRVNGTAISFSTDECNYRGNVVGALPDGAQGTVTCRVVPMGGGPAVSYSGTWRVSHGAAAVTLAPDSALVAEGDTVRLVPTAYDAAGHVISRAFAWASGDSADVTVDQGLASGIQIGGAEIIATTVPAVPLEDTIAGSTFVRVFYGFGSLSAGWLHTCGARSTGGALCWGPGADGRLGSGSGEQPRPTAVTGSLTFATTSAGIQHTCGVTTAGAAYCWGRDLAGELGNGAPTENQGAPSAVAGGITFDSISAGNYFTCGVTTSGVGYCWGYGADGRLGDSTASDRDTPAAVAGGLTFRMISTSKNAILQPVGDGFACGVTDTDSAYCWGRGPLGNDSVTSRSFPIAVAGGLSFHMVSAGQEHACGITTTGAAYCWGSGADGRLGTGGTSPSKSPVPVTGGHTFTHIAAGGTHTCGVTASGAAYCWGGNLLGQLGIGSTSSSQLDPTPVAGNLIFRTVTVGAAHSCGVTPGRLAYCWGRGIDGQLGTGGLSNHSTPQRVGF